MGIRIERPGQFTTVQDKGRYGYQRFGFGVTGAMDGMAFRLANLIMGNPAEQSMLEFTIVGPKLIFTEAVWAVVTGGDFLTFLNGVPVPDHEALEIRAGDVLDITVAQTGTYGYLAFSKALDVPRIMGSDSTNVKSRVGGFCGRILKIGDELRFRNPGNPNPGVLLNGDDYSGRKLSKEDLARLGSSANPSELRVILGPQQDAFTQAGIDTFLNSVYTLSDQADRMGYRMNGPAIAHKAGADIISDGTVFGVVQVPADGHPIILMADRQTTGGYTKIATVISSDLPQLVQGGPGAAYRFRAVSVNEAQELLRATELNVKKLSDCIEQKSTYRGRRTSNKIGALLHSHDQLRLGGK